MTTLNLGFFLTPFTGDTGTGGIEGLVPAPPAGSAGAGDFLSAAGNWATPGGGGAVTDVSATLPLASTGGTTPNISINPSGVMANIYSYATVGVSALGLVTSISSGVSPVTAVNVSAPIASTGGLTPTISLSSSGVSAASYTYASLTVDIYGRITAASNGTAPVTNITVSSPITTTGGTTPNIGLASSGVTSGSYTTANITVDSYGRVTSASNGAGGGNYIFISQQIATSSSIVSFTNLSNSYSMYEVIITGITPTASSANVEMQCSINNGSSYDTGNFYSWAGPLLTVNNSTSVGAGGAIATSNISLTAAFPMQPTAGAVFNVEIYNAGVSSNLTALYRSSFPAIDESGKFIFMTGTGLYQPSSPPTVNAIRFLMSTGNIATGTFTLYGLTT